MAQPTYSSEAIVLRKTKLNETDLILTLLSEEGSIIKCVAKGARKPTSTFASRCELFSQASFHLSKGRSLDIAKEVRLIDGHPVLRTDFELSSCASAMVELLGRIAQESLDAPRLYAMTAVALSALEQSEPPLAYLVCVAHLMKACAFSGFNPSLRQCILCGNDTGLLSGASELGFSLESGGCVCDACFAGIASYTESAEKLRWVDALINSTFEQILSFDADETTAFALLRFAQEWTQAHIGVNLKSLNLIIGNLV